MSDNPLSDLIHGLSSAIGEEKPGDLLRTDLTSRILYSTDASIYQIMPLGVGFPRTEDDLQAMVEGCARYQIPVIARGSGSSLAGQVLGQAFIIDCTRYLNKVIAIDQAEKTATVQPGVILTELNRQAHKFNLQFGPDPASADRASMAGSIANNAAGAHSILYGMAADHILGVDVILSDGQMTSFGPIRVELAEQKANLANPASIETAIYRAALEIRSDYQDEIISKWPKTWRRASGYSLNYLIPWSSSKPPWWDNSGSYPSGDGSQQAVPYPNVKPGEINLSHLLAGSEGTLAVMRRIRVNLVKTPKETILAVIAYPSIQQACDAVPALLETEPSAIELIPFSLIYLANSVPAYARQLSVLGKLCHLDAGPQDQSGAILVVEYMGETRQEVLSRAQALGRQALLLEASEEQSQVWAVRKVGLGILMSRPGETKPAAFIEDIAVPVARLGEFVRRMNAILDDHDTTAEIYAHASAGCLHFRPLLNLKGLNGISKMRSIAEQAVELTLELGGSISGEHGDGLARSMWLRKMYGERIVEAFELLKGSADPNNLMNPGKIASGGIGQSVGQFDENLRYGRITTLTKDWQPALDFHKQAGLLGAVEQCNGAGVCRKMDGLMCPSFQATALEMHSTRGRANLLRALMNGEFQNYDQGQEAVLEALDLCLACKGCKAECPSGVDVAKLRYEFLHHYYKSHRRKSRDYLFGNIAAFARVLQPFGAVLNPLLDSRWARKTGEKALGISSARSLPGFSHRRMGSRYKATAHRFPFSEKVIFLSDPFTEYFSPGAGLAALRALEAAGCQPVILPILGAGRTYISKGFLDSAKKHAAKLVELILQADPTGELAIVGVEPSEIYSLKDEFFDLLPGDRRVDEIARRVYTIEEYLIRPGSDNIPRVERIGFRGIRSDINQKVLFHGHCYQKAQPPHRDGFPTGAAASEAFLQYFGYDVKTVQSGCCGMAGAFGYEVEHFDISRKIGEMVLLPTVRESPGDIVISTPGFSCQAQIFDATGRQAIHPVEVIFQAAAVIQP